MALLFFLLLFVTVLSHIFRRLFFRHDVPLYGRRKPLKNTASPSYRFARKPEWVRKEIIRMKALMVTAGCRSLADSFNRRFTNKGMSVGKTFVNNTIRQNRYEIQLVRKKLKHKKPRPMPLNRVWAMDLTGKQDTNGNIHNILGLVEHGSRANLSLVGLRDKTSITLLRHLLDAVEKYGKPVFLRTDNEPIFTS